MAHQTVRSALHQRPPEPRGRIWPLSACVASPAFNWLALATVLVVAALFTGVNIFHFPHYESDEGTYMGSAWAMFKQGKLSYYTYNYDHPPLGWAIIGLRTMLIGGFTAFGSAVNAGRALMWVITVGSALLLYLLVRRATGKTAPGVLATVLFAVSPLGLDLPRQVWLDNLTTFFPADIAVRGVTSQRKPHLGRAQWRSLWPGLLDQRDHFRLCARHALPARLNRRQPWQLVER